MEKDGLLIVRKDSDYIVQRQCLEGTSGGLIAILYFKHIFTLEPIRVAKSSSHSELRPSTAPHHLPVAAEAGCP